MRIKKIIASLAIFAVTSVFATATEDISVLVDKINNTTDKTAKSVYLKQLDDKLEGMDKKDLPLAQEIINKNLKQKG